MEAATLDAAHSNYQAVLKFKALKSQNRKVALDIDPVTGELACRCTDNGQPNGQGLGSVPMRFTERWVRILDTDQPHDGLLKIAS